MNKRKLIDEVEVILANHGFNRMDYVMSLQGPTLILAQTGNEKMTQDLRKKITDTGCLIL